MTTTTPEEFLFGSGQTAKFEQIGQRHTGIVLSRPVTRPQTDYNTKRPLFWPNGDPMEQMVIRLLTQEREDADDDGVRVLYIDNQRKKEVLRDACREAGVKRIEVGGLIDIAYTGDGPKEGGGNPPKLYWVAYQAPTQQTLAAVEAYLRGPGPDQHLGAARAVQGPPPGGQVHQPGNYNSAPAQSFPQQPQFQPPPSVQPASQQPQWGPPPQPAQGFPQHPAYPQPQGQVPWNPRFPTPESQPPVPPPAPQPQQAQPSWTPEIIAALKAAGQDPKSIYPDYDGRYDTMTQIT